MNEPIPPLRAVSKITLTSRLAKAAKVSRIWPTLQYLEGSYEEIESLLVSSDQVSVESDWDVDGEVVPVVLGLEFFHSDGEVLLEVQGVEGSVETGSERLIV
jgi:hypothetical protein